jgi:hypothetical protein
VTVVAAHEAAWKEPDPVSAVVDNLILDLLEWIGPGERPYLETMEAWRTSCPRLPVWEDATDLGFIERRHQPGRGALRVSHRRRAPEESAGPTIDWLRRSAP